MMKIFRNIMIFIFAFTLIVCFPKSVNAEEDLEIPKWIVNADLIENGDLNIVEDITFEFNDDFNGVFREIVLDKTAGVSDIQVQELIGDIESVYTHVEDAEKGDSNVFLTKKENDKIIIQIFSPSENQEKTFRISYVVKSVAIKYNDTGELYYKFLGDENETPIGSFVVNIKLPQADINNKVKVFAHGPLNGEINKENNTTYSLNIDNVPSGTFIEGRILFPNEFIPTSNNVQNIDNYSNIIEEEEAFQNKLIEDKIRKTKIKSVLENISIWISGFGLVTFLIFLTSFRRKNKHENEEYTSIPEDCTPAVASYLTGTIIGTNTIFATILDLLRKGYLKINEEDKQGQNSDDQNFIITKLKKEDHSLLGHEKHFMNWLFNEMGNGDSVSTNEIENFNKHNSSKFLNLYTSWKNKIKEDMVHKGYYDKSKKKYGVFFLSSFFLLLILAIVTLVYGSLFGLASLGISVIFLIYSITLLYRLSDYGHNQHKKWISFKKYMKKYNKDLSIEDLMKYPSDISLIYALSLDVGKKLDEFNYNKANYSNQLYSHNGWIIWYLLFMNNENNAFNKSMNSSFGGATGSYSGGGFSGGGGGGAGGGGAGGF